MLVVAGDVAGTACSRAICVQCFVHGLEDLWVSTHTKVVIGAPDSHSFVASSHVRLRKFLRESIDVVEVAVGLVFMLFIKLGIVEILVVESGHFGDVRLWSWCPSFGLLSCRQLWRMVDRYCLDGQTTQSRSLRNHFSIPLFSRAATSCATEAR